MLASLLLAATCNTCLCYNVKECPCESGCGPVMCNERNLKEALKLAAKYAPVTEDYSNLTLTSGSISVFSTWTPSPPPKGGDDKRKEAAEATKKAASLSKEAEDLDFIADVLRVCGLDR